MNTAKIAKVAVYRRIRFVQVCKRVVRANTHKVMTTVHFYIIKHQYLIGDKI